MFSKPDLENAVLYEDLKTLLGKYGVSGEEIPESATPDLSVNEVKEKEAAETIQEEVKVVETVGE